MTILCSKPYVQSVCWQELADTQGPSPEMPLGGLLLPNGSPKPALARLAQIRQVIREGRSPTALITAR
jgi:hypothetical protein